MKNYMKILCVVLALVVALSAASCSLTKQYAYQQDDIEVPIGVYIFNMYAAYTEAQSLAQKSESYDSETGKYDGSKSFLKIEITDEDGNTAVAEDWIKDKAAETTKEDIAINYKFNELGCTLDEAQNEQAKTYYQSYWDQQYAETFEGYGVSFDSFFWAEYTVNAMKSEAFKAEYGTDGPSAVSDEELTKYFKDNFTSYKYISANLYTSEATDDETGSGESTTVNVALPEDKVKEYQEDFDSYASTISNGGSFDDVVTEYMEKYSIEEDPRVESVEVIDADTTDETLKTIKEMKDGEAKVVEVGEEDNNKQIYLLYREPIEDEVAAYTDPEQHKDDVLSKMKETDFDDLIKGLVEELGITLTSACDSYNPSMFEETKKS